MNLRNAERFLACHRTGQPPEKAVRKALGMAESNAGLKEKLAAQLRFDEQMTQAIHSIEPPPDLREKLRALGGASAAACRPSLWAQMFHPAMLPVLAGVLLIVGFLVWMELDRRADFPGRSAVMRIVAVADEMSGVELEPTQALAGELGDAFYVRGFEGFTLPRELAGARAVGSRVFKQAGHPIAQIALDSQNALLYVFRASDFGVDPGRKKRWRLLTQDPWVVAVRENKGICIVLAFRGDAGEMERFLKTLSP